MASAAIELPYRYMLRRAPATDYVCSTLRSVVGAAIAWRLNDRKVAETVVQRSATNGRNRCIAAAQVTKVNDCTGSRTADRDAVVFRDKVDGRF